MAKLVTIFGGSGFVGRHIARRMADAGWRVRVACRNPNEALFVRTYGAVGQVEPVACNIRDDASVAAALQGADAAVNCVGILAEKRHNKFDAVQDEGAARVAQRATAAGVRSLVHISAIGADAQAASDYLRSKGEGEAAVRAAFPNAVILRPSIIFGPEDDFFNRFGEMLRWGPVLPVVGGKTLFQPVYVDDVAAAAEVALTAGVPAGIYELGGPDTESLNALMRRLLNVTRRWRLLINLPFWVGAIMGRVISLAHRLSLGIVPLLLTGDQVKSLRHDNVVSDDAQGFDAFGITPTPMEVILPDYLWRFRPQGQYTDLTASAKNLNG